MEMTEPPIRLCCGKGHYGAQCPDGLVMCCICFGRFPITGLYTDDVGITWDLCKRCESETEERKS